MSFAIQAIKELEDDQKRVEQWDWRNSVTCMANGISIIQDCVASENYKGVLHWYWRWRLPVRFDLVSVA